MSKEYYNAHRDEIREQQGVYYATHKGERSAYMKKYYAIAGEEIKRKKRERYQARREKACAWMREFRSNNKERVAVIQRKAHLKRAYGMTPEAWDDLFISQGSKCALCMSLTAGGRGWHVDHDHSTGAVRGIICRNCNLVLGHAKDNIDTLYAAIRYLESFRKALEIAKQ